MRKQLLGVLAGGVTLLAVSLSATGLAAGQSVTPVPSLDVKQFMGAWFEVARLPNKAEKGCLSDGMVLYALGSKKGSFEMGTFCKVKQGNTNDIEANGKLDKHGSGRLGLTHLLFLHRPYWVLATGPDFQWALVGTPNHKSLWILSKTAKLPPDVYASIVSQANAEGFHTAKLISVQHTGNIFPPGHESATAPGDNPPGSPAAASPGTAPKDSSTAPPR